MTDLVDILLHALLASVIAAAFTGIWWAVGGHWLVWLACWFGCLLAATWGVMREHTQYETKYRIPSRIALWSVQKHLEAWVPAAILTVAFPAATFIIARLT